MTGAGLRAAVVVPAGGAGLRMGGRRKQYLDLLGEPILLRSLRPFLEHPAVVRVVVALPPDDVASPPAFLPPDVTIVAGGAERGDSVRMGLEAIGAEADLVVIHDAARPLVTREIIDRAITAAATGVGAVAAVGVGDTIKRVDAGGRIVGTVDRAGLWRAQTPQAFPRAMIVDAYRRAREEGIGATDDAALVERYGGTVVVVDGSPLNIKITTAEDLAHAELLLGARHGPG